MSKTAIASRILARFGLTTIADAEREREDDLARFSAAKDHAVTVAVVETRRVERQRAAQLAQAEASQDPVAWGEIGNV